MTVPLKKSGFIPAHREAGLVKTKLQKSFSVSRSDAHAHGVTEEAHELTPKPLLYERHPSESMTS